jgi:hypothetical protein
VDTDRRQSAAARIIGRRRLDSAALIEGGASAKLLGDQSPDVVNYE